MTKVRYIYHSGFEVETENAVLVFDYYDPKNKYEILSNITEKNVYVFVSHAHPDHFDKKIFDLRGRCNVKYILSDDVISDEGDDITYVTSGMRYIVDGLEVTTLRSTDEGVAFVVDTGGEVIYHAGDLNWWHWNGETEAYNAAMADDYMGQIEKLRDVKIDIAFIPLDGRLEDKYLWGMDYCMKNVEIKSAFPMHFWRNFSLSKRIKEDVSSESYRDRIIDIEKDNETFIL